ncbi:MAG: triose-phosphate isomerase [Candidatus Omnitrophica bacterium]|nr:triose-phosphate isomerase [Candidatus Omnitrophota bacterium]
MRKPMIAGNWKMHKIISESVALSEKIKNTLEKNVHVDVVVCPVFTALNTVYSVLEDTDIGLGAQNLYWEKEGAFTGEISPIMLKDSGCEYVIIGHSERRKYFSETDEMVNKKIKAALEIGLTPIVCVGETLEEREAAKETAVINAQLEGAFNNIDINDMGNVIIAYEPVWAIGTGKTATPQQAQQIHQFIRQWLTDNKDNEVSAAIRILYGGSVKPENIKELMDNEDIDGALVGGASLKAETFAQIVKNAKEVI